MLKYITPMITCIEIPDEISLVFSITGCTIKCEDCHSKHLWDNVGDNLTLPNIVKEYTKHKHVSCITFFGGEHDSKAIIKYGTLLKHILKINTGWYIGRDFIDFESIRNAFTYIKVGRYIKELGGLESVTSNQKLYKRNEEGLPLYNNITHKFRRF